MSDRKVSILASIAFAALSAACAHFDHDLLALLFFLMAVSAYPSKE